jgi:Tfp pilus assembly protein FimT
VTDARGFTLIDTLVTAALCAVTGAIAVPVIGGTLDRERTLIGAQFVSGQLHRARLESLTRGRAVAVRFAIDGGRTAVQLFADDDGDGVRQSDVDAGAAGVR